MATAIKSADLVQLVGKTLETKPAWVRVEIAKDGESYSIVTLNERGTNTDNGRMPKMRIPEKMLETIRTSFRDRDYVPSRTIQYHPDGTPYVSFVKKISTS